MYGLGFLPLAPEHYDFLLVESRRERPAVQAFLAALRDAATRERIRALGMQPVDDCYWAQNALHIARCCCRSLSGARAGAIARPWRAGARAGDLARRQERDLRQLRHLGDPLVARAQRRRAGAALPRQRGERGRLAQGRPHRHRRRGRADRDLDARQAAARQSARRPHRADRRARGVAGRHAARLGVVGSHRAAVAARGRRAARARRPQQNVNGVAFTPDGQALVSAGYDATLRIWPLAGGAPTIVARCRRRSMPSRSRPTARSSPAGADGKVYFLSPQGEVRGEVEASADADHRARRLARRRAGRRRRHPRLGRGHRPRRRASSRARWSGPACRCGRWRSFPTAARC